MAKIITNAEEFSQYVDIASSEIDSYAVAANSLRAFKFVHIMTINGENSLRLSQNEKLLTELDRMYFNVDHNTMNTSESSCNDAWYEFPLCNYGCERTLVLFKIKAENRLSTSTLAKKFFVSVCIKALMRLSENCQSRVSNTSYDRYNGIEKINDTYGSLGKINIYASDRISFCQNIDHILKSSNVLNAIHTRVFFYRSEHNIREERIAYMLDMLTGENNLIEELLDKDACEKDNLLACFQIHYAVNFCPKGKSGALLLNKYNLKTILDRPNAITYYEKLGFKKLCHFCGYSGIKDFTNITYVQAYSNQENCIRGGRNVSFTAFKCMNGHTNEDLYCEKNPEAVLDLRIETMKKFERTKQFLKDTLNMIDLRFEMVFTSFDSKGPSIVLQKYFKRFGKNNDEWSEHDLQCKLVNLLINKKCVVIIPINSIKNHATRVIIPKFEIITASYENVIKYDAFCKKLVSQELSEMQDHENKLIIADSLIAYLKIVGQIMPSKKELLKLYTAEVSLRYLLSGTTELTDYSVLQRINDGAIYAGTLLETANLNTSTFPICQDKIGVLYNPYRMDYFPNIHYRNAMIEILSICDIDKHYHYIKLFKLEIEKINKQPNDQVIEGKNSSNMLIFLNRLKKTLIRQQLLSYLILLGNYFTRYCGLNHLKLGNVLDCFKFSTIPTSRVEGLNQAFMVLDDGLMHPKVKDVVECLLHKQKQYKLNQFTRSLGIPCSRRNGESKNYIDNAYEFICQLYIEEMMELIRENVEVVPITLLDGGDSSNNLRWIRINKCADPDTFIEPMTSCGLPRHSSPMPIDTTRRKRFKQIEKNDSSIQNI